MPDPKQRKLIFTDTETTGLSLNRHQIVELAYAVDDEMGHSGTLPHTLDEAEPAALEVNCYFQRGLGDPETWDIEILDRFMKAAAGNIIVGANPSFDAYRIERLADYATWHYRLGDIESAAWLLLGFDEPPGLRAIREKLTQLGYSLPEPTHTAGGDVATTRDAFRILQRIALYLLAEGLPTAEQLSDWEQHKP